MAGAHRASHRRGRRRVNLRWVGLRRVGLAVLVTAVAGVTVLAFAPAGGATADAPVPVQLTLAGLASAQNPTGGSTVQIKPGSAVDLTPAALPTKGVPALGDVLNGLLGGVAQPEIVIASSNVAGLSKGTKIGPCPTDQKSVTVRPAGVNGTSNTFTYTVNSVVLLPLLGCTVNAIDLSSAQLAALTANQVAVNADNVYSGNLLIADNPVGGIGVQLPGVSVQPTILGQQLPKLGLPGTTLGIPMTVPSLPGSGLPALTTPKLPAVGPGAATAKSGVGAINYQPPGLQIPDLVVPKGFGDGSANVPNTSGGAGSALTSIGAGLPNLGAAMPAIAALIPGQNTSPGPVTSLARSSALASAQAEPLGVTPAAVHESTSSALPMLLALLAIIVLSLVTATYARLYLLRRPTA